MAPPILQALPHLRQLQLGPTIAFRPWGVSTQRMMRGSLDFSFSVQKKTRAVSASSQKQVWVWTCNKDVMTAAVEGGWNTFIFTPDTEDLATAWMDMAKINPLLLREGQFHDTACNQIAIFGQIASGDEQDTVRSLVGKSDIVVMDCLEWQIIPAENMVAAFQKSISSIFATATTAKGAKLCFEALEIGTDGVVLKTEDPREVFDLKTYLNSRQQSENRVSLIAATVTRVEPVGMGDRVCVDLCSLLRPGEGLLVGSFARALFLVHSECLETSYVRSRPFRVNAGPVHAYIAMPGGRTSYLSELQSGVEVLVVDENGQTRAVVVGRLKIESRPLILVEVQADGVKHSVLLQNAETVNLVRPADGKDHSKSLAISVAKVAVGETVLLSIQEGARHTGMKIQEFIVEK